MPEEMNEFLLKISQKFNVIEQQEEAARALFSLYTSYMRAGFTEEQALIIAIQIQNNIINQELNKQNQKEK